MSLAAGSAPDDCVGHDDGTRHVVDTSANHSDGRHLGAVDAQLLAQSEPRRNVEARVRDLNTRQQEIYIDKSCDDPTDRLSVCRLITRRLDAVSWRKIKLSLASAPTAMSRVAEVSQGWRDSSIHGKTSLRAAITAFLQERNLVIFSIRKSDRFFFR